VARFARHLILPEVGMEGRPLTGAPPLLKTRRHMRRDAARKLWRKLQEQAWAERHAHERRLHDSALAQLRHG